MTGVLTPYGSSMASPYPLFGSNHRALFGKASFARQRGATPYGSSMESRYPIRVQSGQTLREGTPMAAGDGQALRDASHPGAVGCLELVCLAQGKVILATAGMGGIFSSLPSRARVGLSGVVQNRSSAASLGDRRQSQHVDMARATTCHSDLCPLLFCPLLFCLLQRLVSPICE